MARSGPSRKLGLDDPNVIERDDRGERDYNLNLQHELAPSIGPIPNHANLQDTNGNGLIPLIRSELEINMIPRSPDSYSHFFIPRDKLRSIITADRVLQIIQQLYCRNLSPFQISELQTRICFGSTQCWKLFAVLLLSDKLDNLLDLVDKEGVSDNCLPIRLKTRCCLKKHKHPTIESWPIQVRGSASMWSYAVKAPYFTRPSGGHYHYILDGNDVIPIIGTVTNESASNAPVKHQKSGNDNGTVDGGFGQVTRVILDESHYHFEDLAVSQHYTGLDSLGMDRLLISTVTDRLSKRSTATVRPQKIALGEPGNIQSRARLAEKLPRPERQALDQIVGYLGGQGDTIQQGDHDLLPSLPVGQRRSLDVLEGACTRESTVAKVFLDGRRDFPTGPSHHALPQRATQPAETNERRRR